jgi:predicted nucleotidyltransferase
MLTQKQLKVLDTFRKNYGKKLTFNEIKTQSGIKSNSFVQRTLSNCMHEGIVETESIGKGMLVYKLKINNVSLSYFQLINFELYNLPINILYKIQEAISETTYAYSLVVFGSYAKNKQNKDSDLDIAIIVENKESIKEIKANIESIKLEEFTKIDYEVFTKEEFKEMLDSKKENVGKEIARHNIIFNNPKLFYKIIEKWNLQ